MKCSKSTVLVLAALVMALAVKSHGQQQPAAPAPVAAVDPKADAILKQMGAALKDAASVSFSAHAIVDQVLTDGRKVQYARNQKVLLRRPDKLAADVIGDNEELQFRYDGKQVALYNPRTKSWGAAAAPASIDQTLDLLAQKYGMVMPLADLAFSDPYQCLIENVRRGEYLGLGYVFDTQCHHLAFRQATVDWQIWIETGERPLPRKVVITFKDSPAHPQYTAFLSDWNLSAKVDESAFTLKPPQDAKKVEFAPATQPAAAAAPAAEAR